MGGVQQAPRRRRPRGPDAARRALRNRSNLALAGGTRGAAGLAWGGGFIAGRPRMGPPLAAIGAVRRPRGKAGAAPACQGCAGLRALSSDATGRRDRAGGPAAENARASGSNPIRPASCTRSRARHRRRAASSEQARHRLSDPGRGATARRCSTKFRPHGALGGSCDSALMHEATIANASPGCWGCRRHLGVARAPSTPGP